MSSKIYDELKSCKEKKVRKRKTYVSDTKFIKLLVFCSLSFSEKSFVRLENPVMLRADGVVYFVTQETDGV